MLLSFTYFSFTTCVDALPDILSYPTAWTQCQQACPVSDGYWCTHCCPFHLHFSYLNTLYSPLWNITKTFSEAGSILGSLRETKDPCKWLKLHLPPYTTEGVVTVTFLLLQFGSCRILSQQDGLTLRTLLHSLYGDGNLPFLLFNIMNCGKA